MRDGQTDFQFTQTRDAGFSPSGLESVDDLESLGLVVLVVLLLGSIRVQM